MVLLPAPAGPSMAMINLRARKNSDSSLAPLARNDNSKGHQMRKRRGGHSGLSSLRFGAAARPSVLALHVRHALRRELHQGVMPNTEQAEFACGEHRAHCVFNFR